MNFTNHYLQQQQQHQQQQQQLPQHQQHSSFNAIPHQNSNHSEITSLNQPSVQSETIEYNAGGSTDNNSSVNQTFTSVQSNSTVVKPNPTGTTSKVSSASTSPVKKFKCQCEICFKEFGHKSNLFIHMRTHNGERPYKCKECGKCFTHSGNLAIHTRVHRFDFY